MDQSRSLVPKKGSDDRHFMKQGGGGKVASSEVYSNSRNRTENLRESKQEKRNTDIKVVLGYLTSNASRKPFSFSLTPP